MCLYLIEADGGSLCGGDHRSYCGEESRTNFPSADLRYCGYYDDRVPTGKDSYVAREIVLCVGRKMSASEVTESFCLLTFLLICFKVGCSTCNLGWARLRTLAATFAWSLELN